MLLIVLLKTFKQFAAPNRARAHYHYVRDASTFQSGNRVVQACPIYVNLVGGIPLGGEDDPIRFQCQDTSEDRVIATFTKRNVSEVDVQKRGAARNCKLSYPKLVSVLQEAQAWIQMCRVRVAREL